MRLFRCASINPGLIYLSIITKVPFPLKAVDTRTHVHLVKLGAGRGDLLNPELAELSLQLAELLGELILVLVPELASLDLS